MSKFTDALRERKIFNTSLLLKRFGKAGKDVGISFHAAHSVMPASTRIFSPSFQTAPTSPWYNYGSKSFAGIKRVSHAKAVAWAEATYNVKMVKGPFGEWVPVEVIEAAEKNIKENQ